jgi:phosphate transport system ATP-binding protein
MTEIPTTDVRIDTAVLAAEPRPFTSEGGNLRAEGVTAWFGKHCIVAGIDMDMPAGSVTSIIGPSGCGKSTFLRTLNRMHELVPNAAMAGAVLLDGTDIYAAGSRPALMRLRIGMVFQKPNPFPTMSIGENVLSGLNL